VAERRTWLSGDVQLRHNQARNAQCLQARAVLGAEREVDDLSAPRREEALTPAPVAVELRARGYETDLVFAVAETRISPVGKHVTCYELIALGVGERASRMCAENSVIHQREAS